MKAGSLMYYGRMFMSIAAAAALATSVKAAPIVTSQLTNDESKIINTGGAVIAAVNFGSQQVAGPSGSHGMTQTVDINGIVHQVASASNGGDGADLISNVTTNSTFDGNFRYTAAGSVGYTGDLRNLIAGIAGVPSPGPLTVDVSGLTSGVTYLFQGYWEANAENQVISVTFEGTDTLTGISGNGMATVISYEFTASDNTLNVSLSKTAGSDSLWLQGFSLQVVPEPGSMALIALGGLMFLRRRGQ